MVWNKSWKYSPILFFVTVTVFLAGLVFWLSKNYALEKPKVFTKVVKTISLPDSLFYSQSYTPKQIDSFLKAQVKDREVYWEVRKTQSNKLVKFSQLQSPRKNLDSFLYLLPDEKIAKIFIHVGAVEVVRSMWLSIALAVLLLFLLCGSAFFLIKSFRYMQALNSMKLDFFHNITHELKTPVAGIIATTELLRDYGLGEHPERRKEMLNRILIEAHRLNTLVENIIDLSTLDQQSHLLNKEIIHIPELIKKIIDRFKTQTEKRKALIIHEDQPLQNFKVNGNKNLIDNVISVLLDNALKYGGEGVEIKIAYTINEGALYVSIADNGPGIPRSERDELFQKFYRSGADANKEIKGSGLGLHYAKKIMELHEGDLQYFSLDKGSCFRIKFPLY
jgi:signal transduction histidine kinase